MYTRYVTYDIKDGNSYDDLYDFFETKSATKLTESTYLVKSNDPSQQFSQELKNATSKVDTIYYIYITTKNNMLHRKVR